MSLVVFASPPVPASTATGARLLTKARSYQEQGKCFWACEAWQDVLRKSPESAAAREHLAEALRHAEEVLMTGGASPEQKLYFECLRDFLTMDCSVLWDGWKKLETIPTHAEEARWFLWGPAASFYRKALGDPDWRRAALLFRQGWGEFERSRWKSASALFEECRRLRPDHFLAAHYLRLCEDRLSRLAVSVPAAMEVKLREERIPPAVRSFQGSLEERFVRGEGEFRRGHSFLALAWFKSVVRKTSGKSDSKAVQERAARAVRRLEWMFAEGPLE